MSFNVTLALDLDGATASQIGVVENKLLSRNWVRYDDGQNYCTTFVGKLSDSEILQASQDDLATAASLAELRSWNGVCLIANSAEDWDEGEQANQHPDECVGQQHTVASRTMVAAS